MTIMALQLRMGCTSHLQDFDVHFNLSEMVIHVLDAALWIIMFSACHYCGVMC